MVPIKLIAKGENRCKTTFRVENCDYNKLIMNKIIPEECSLAERRDFPVSIFFKRKL